ncbi:MAG TPA: protoporphyrinogen oxidase HemJ [Acidocella sp.]|jgi:putative membrane protein|uniref:protoporphyrinogen oxidase HemJ n=1 Tax=Acidocella sp. TaxID=50710 RepID=UPI002C640F3A|nr:protoporphyrinogen oxidase HemJ [Acidocella sp.]HVE22879.1 protoporphyrinogen oxidase HemJ [Acidocella sp.]
MTIDALARFFHIILAFHIISFTAWMAGLFYLPRLYVYHCQTVPGSAESARFKVMERRLLRQIINPAMIATWICGILLVLTPGAVNWHAAWWWTKLIAVLLMSGFHGACSKWRKNFLNDANTKSEKFYRIANEVPTVLFVIIVLVVVI